MWPNTQFPVVLVTFTEEILNGKLHILCSGSSQYVITQIVIYLGMCLIIIFRYMEENRKMFHEYLSILLCNNWFRIKKQVKFALMCSLREIHWKNGSSRPEVFCKKIVLRNFAKFTGKHLCQGLFFNKVAWTLVQVFSC